MPSVYGNPIWNGAAWLRLRIDYDYSLTGDGRAGVTGAMWVESRYSVSDSSNSGSFGWNLGTWGGATGISHGGGGGATAMVPFGGYVDLAYGANTDLHMYGSISGVEAVPGTASIDVHVTLPPRPFELPGAPTSVRVERVSDTQHIVRWSAPAWDPAAPVNSYAVQRQRDWDPWATIMFVDSTVDAYADATTEPDRRYRYRVVALNDRGAGPASAETGEIATTPAGPSNLVALRNNAGGVDLSWTDNSSIPSITWIVLHSTDGWVTRETLALTLPKAQRTFTHTSPNPAVPHAYIVQAQCYTGTTPNESRWSTWATSNTVQLLIAPNAPAQLATEPALLQASESTTLRWQHNPVDSSPQSKFQIRFRLVGAATWTMTDVFVSGGYLPLSPGAGWGLTNGQVIEWQVRTWGAHADPSPWSATATFTLSTRPIATIATDDEVHTSRLTTTWGYYDAESTAQSAWNAELRTPAGQLAEAPRSGTGTTASVTWATVAPDGSAWVERVRVQDGAGMWSAWDEHPVTVTYIRPLPAVVTTSWDPVTGTVSLGITNPMPLASGFGEGGFGEGAFGGSGSDGGPLPPETHHVDVWRSIDGGPWEQIIVGATPNTALPDHAPTVAGENRYRVDAASELGAIASTTVTVETSGANAVFISGGPGFSQVCRATREVTVTDITGRTRVLHQFAGRGYPVETAGEEQTETWSLEADIIPVAADPGSSPDEWRALSRLAGPHLWRDPDGHRVRVSLGKPRLTRAKGGTSWHLALEVERTDA